MSPPRAPSHLSREAKRWWRQIQREYAILDSPGLLLLTQAAEAFDRLRDCQAVIKADGPTVVDRFGQTKAHPLLAAERDARSQVLAALRALDLSVEPEAVADVVPWRQRKAG